MPQTKDTKLPFGNFSSWLTKIRYVLKSSDSMEVPCGDCRACCTSSYFIHIRPNETKTISQIPKELLFAAPGLPKGHLLLGYDKNGHCPMFVNNACSIYENRPQTCRHYDCRILSATGFMEDEGKPLISQQAIRWEINLSSKNERNEIIALKSAAIFLINNKELFPNGFIPLNPIQQAVLAIKVNRVFLDELPDLEQINNRKQIVTNILEEYKKSGTNA